MLHQGEIIEERPDLVGAAASAEVADPANIVWTNRGQASDGFDARFGASAAIARAVVDAVIVQYERMIGSFNYSSAGQTYGLSVSMAASGSGFGAGAGLGSSLGGKPKSGSITMGAGNGSADPNDDNGWFLDPTPFDHSEFQGNIVNAYSGDAHVGSPAYGKNDFYTVVAAELTHCVGLFGDALPGWASRTFNTGIPDNTAAPGTFWVFDGPSIKHLLTSDNGFFQDWGSAIHSAEGAGANINFNGLNWIGSEDQGNPGYEGSRRYMVNNAFALMFKDAYGYATVDPERDGTMYSILNQSNGQVLVRGGAGTSADHVEIFRSANNTLTVAVDVGNDVPGTGALPGAGNLGSFVTVYDISQVSSIVVNTGSGDDTIVIDTTNFQAGLSESITINAGAGNDSLIMSFFSGNLDFFTGPITFNGESGTDDAIIYDTAATFSDTYTVTSTNLDRTVFGGITYSGNESLTLRGEDGHNTFNINSTPVGMTMTLDGGEGNDTFNVGGSGLNAENIDGSLVLAGGNGVDTVSFNDQNNVLTTTFTISNTSIARSRAATTGYATVESLVLNAGSGADTLNLQTVTGNIPMTLNAGGGNDSFSASLEGYVNQGTSAAISLNGATGSDSITVSDTFSTAAGTVTISGTAFSRTASPVFSYSASESLTWTGGAGAETYNVQSTLATTPLVVNAASGADTINVVSTTSPATVSGGAGLDTLTVNSDGAGTARVDFTTTQDFAALNILAGGTANLASGGSGNRHIFTNALSISGTGTLDLNDNDLILNYTGPSQLVTVQYLITLARAGGAWSGFGITSSSAKNNPQGNTTLAAIEATEFDSLYGSTATFAGVNPDATAVLVKYTWYGDADLNGQVDFDDYVRSDAGLNNNLTGWINGDFDANGNVDFDDYVLLDLGFNTQGAAQ